ncbi:uncharacterized protein PITG_02803 [Phytophthora infestans T30-4]|uniref:SAM domain-containing protein n=1 Tax=Phytophthora infestans (strain T30-4) TaxID=403677 RepID=D0MX96_PHYIT|nr:uncharacterized protein PITG_02803 [Phytophthora infestans T30-4]EEY64259.1 conserved hypothetical protein [Phytophthora infestans T30-4]|eukprot:XP_002907695.1 conserved hypothetical protein [Phytophthora infestans T30-4]
MSEPCDSALVFPPCASFEKPHDLDIVRKIVEREGCLEALQQLLGAASKPQQPRISGISKAPIVFQSVIDQLRSVSVQIVEDIDQWQQMQKAKAQAIAFKWRGVNYLLKMTADLDFLTSFRGVALLESLQVLRLMQNPFLAHMHLDHPILRESDPESAVQVFGNWVGDVSIRRVFSASKLLLREREAETRRRLEQAPEQRYPLSTDEVNNDSAAVAPIKSQQRTSSTRAKVRYLNQDHSETSLGTAPASTSSREAAMREDIALSREFIAQAERELGAMRDDLAALQARLDDTILPDKRRRLQVRIGSLVNDFKFRSGDMYQRRNDLKRKETIYRTIRERRGSEKTYSQLFEAALLEDEQVRNDLVLRVNASLSKARVDEHKRGAASSTPNIEQWGVREVQSFLDSLGLDDGSYGADFRDQGIDGALIAQATDRDLEELGVNIRLHRVRILTECNMKRDPRNG